MPGKYTLTNSAHDVNNWAGKRSILMPDNDFTICFWAKMDMWHVTGSSTLLSIATESKSVYCYFFNLQYLKKPFYLIFIQYFQSFL